MDTVLLTSAAVGAFIGASAALVIVFLIPPASPAQGAAQLFRAFASQRVCIKHYSAVGLVMAVEPKSLETARSSKERVMTGAPNKSFKPNPLRGSA